MRIFSLATACFLAGHSSSIAQTSTDEKCRADLRNTLVLLQLHARAGDSHSNLYPARSVVYRNALEALDTPDRKIIYADTLPMLADTIVSALHDPELCEGYTRNMLKSLCERGRSGG